MGIAGSRMARKRQPRPKVRKVTLLLFEDDVRELKRRATESFTSWHDKARVILHEGVWRKRVIE